MRKRLKIDQYNCELIVIITDKIIDECNKILRRDKSQHRIDYEIEGIFLYHDIDKYYLLLNCAHLTHNTIAHEIYHAVVRITEDREISDEESQAWLMGYITELVYKHIYKNNVQIKLK